MRGDIFIIGAHHRAAARQLADDIVPLLIADITSLAIGISGESGSGKSELAQALSDALSEQDIDSIILQQDDYFHYPPRTNDARRRDDIRWVGPQEVDLDRLDANIAALMHGESIVKPLVIYAENRIATESVARPGARILLIEGTYVSRLRHLSHRIFIDRTYTQTKVARKRRAREAPEPFIERVLDIEHQLIKTQKTSADWIVDSEYSVRRAIGRKQVE